MAALVVLVLVVSGCVGGAPPPVPGGGDLPSGSFGFPDLGEFGGGFTGPANQPTDARVRVVNTYRSETGEPVDIDVYATSFRTEETPPLMTVPYGQASAFFDPTSDQDGNVFLAFYPAGSRDAEELVVSKTETLQGGERITYYVYASEGIGEPHDGWIQAFFETEEAAVPGGGPTPAASSAVLIVAAGALDLVLPGDDSLYLSVGDGCTSYVGGSGDPDAVPQPVAPGGRTVELPGGSHTATLHRYRSTGTVPDCTNESELEFPLSLDAGGRGFLFLFGEDADTIRTIFLPYGG